MERSKKPGPYSGPSGPKHHHKGIRPPSGNFISDIYAMGSRRLGRLSNIDILFMSVLGGAFITVGALLSLLLTINITTPSVHFLLMGLGLSVGFLLVVLTNSALFTEANIFVPSNLYNATALVACLRLFRFWGLAFVGNIVGALVVSLIIYLSQTYSEGFRAMLMSVVSDKVAHVSLGKIRGTGELLLSGMLGNWIVALVSFFALASRNLINQFVIIFLAFLVIVAAGFQYFPVNVAYFCLNLFFGNSIGLIDLFGFNLIPVGVGNILGGALLVGGPLLFLSRRR